MKLQPKRPKSEILPFMTTWMHRASIMLSQINQAKKDKYHRSHLHVKYKTNKHNLKKKTDSEIQRPNGQLLEGERWGSG